MTATLSILVIPAFFLNANEIVDPEATRWHFGISYYLWLSSYGLLAISTLSFYFEHKRNAAESQSHH